MLARRSRRARALAGDRAADDAEAARRSLLAEEHRVDVGVTGGRVDRAVTREGRGAGVDRRAVCGRWAPPLPSPWSFPRGWARHASTAMALSLETTCRRHERLTPRRRTSPQRQVPVSPEEPRRSRDPVQARVNGFADVWSVMSSRCRLRCTLPIYDVAFIAGACRAKECAVPFRALCFRALGVPVTRGAEGCLRSTQVTRSGL